MGNMGGWSETYFEDGVADSEVIAKAEATLAIVGEVKTHRQKT
jgi:hypothetical protein